MIQILLIGRDPLVLQKLLRFINKHPDWEGTGTVDDNSAHILFGQTNYHYVVLVDKLSENSLERIHNDFKNQNPQVIFLHHFGDSTDLLASELNDLMEKHPITLDNSTEK